MGKAAGRLVAFVHQRDERLFICPRTKEKSKPFRPCVQTSALYAKREKDKIRSGVRRSSVTRWPLSVCPENHLRGTYQKSLCDSSRSSFRANAAGNRPNLATLDENYRFRRSCLHRQECLRGRIFERACLVSISLCPS